MVKGMHARRLSKAECPLCVLEGEGRAYYRSMTHTWEPGCWKYEKLNFMAGLYLGGVLGGRPE